MQNLQLTWTHPTRRNDDTPLPVSQFVVHIGMRAVGDPGPFTRINTVAGSDTPEVDIPSVASGDWEFELVVETAQGQVSEGVTLTHSVPFADPNDVSNAAINVV